MSAAPVGQAAVEFIRAGGDLCLICHREDYIAEAYDELVKTAERDSKFARRVAEAVRRVLAFKKKSAKMLPLESRLLPQRSRSCRASLGIWRAGAVGSSESRGECADPADMTKKDMIVAGVMSGTSADGINVALVRMRSAEARSRAARALRQLLGHAEYSYSEKVRAAVLAAMNASRASVADLARLNFLLGELYADAVLGLRSGGFA